MRDTFQFIETRSQFLKGKARLLGVLPAGLFVTDSRYNQDEKQEIH